MQRKKYVWMGCSQWRRGEGRVDNVGDVLSTMKGKPSYVGGVKTGGGLRGRILHQIELIRGYLMSHQRKAKTRAAHKNQRKERASPFHGRKLFHPQPL
jgi:hypothetical protein